MLWRLPSQCSLGSDGDGCDGGLRSPSKRVSFARLPSQTFSDGAGASSTFARLPSNLDDDDHGVPSTFCRLPSQTSLDGASVAGLPVRTGQDAKYARLPSRTKSLRKRRLRVRAKGHLSACAERTSFSLPSGKVVHVDRSLKEMLQPDILDGEPPERRTCAALTVQVPLVALFCASLTMARRFDLKLGHNLLLDCVWHQALDTLALAQSLFVCPPCRLYSCLMQTNWPRMSLASRRLVAELGLKCLKLSVDACHIAGRAGKYFCFEHPAKSLALVLDHVQALLDGPYGAELIYFDQCAFGLTSPAGTPVKKRTFFFDQLPSCYRHFQKLFFSKISTFIECAKGTKRVYVYLDTAKCIQHQWCRLCTSALVCDLFARVLTWLGVYAQWRGSSAWHSAREM